MACLGPSLLEQRDSVVLHSVSLEEQARAGNVRGYLQIPDFPEDPDQTRPDQTRLDQTRLDLCPIRTLTAFFKVKTVNFVFTNYILVFLQVSVICGDSKSFFVSYMKPYRSVTSRTLSRWI